MYLLTTYENAKQEMNNAKFVFDLRKKEFLEIEDKLEIYILNNKIYLTYAQLLELEGIINSGKFIIRYGDAYEKITSNEFNNCIISKNGIIDNRYTNMCWRHIEDNKYARKVGTYISNIEEILGGYDIYIEGKLIEESSLHYLWKKLVK